jgi:hypothetical protein
MSIFTFGTHPTFETLSAHADLDDVKAAGTRIGKHVARCSECRDVVAEIRALGATARAMPIEDASPAMWTRIEAASAATSIVATNVARAVVDVARTESRDATSLQSAKSTLPSLRPRVLVVLGSVALAAAAALVAIVVVPNRASLNATGTSRLTFSPGRPMPGGLLRVRYRPAPWLAGAPRLVLAGRYAEPVARTDASRLGRDLGVFADSLATLLPTADGSYEGIVRLPADFLAVRLFVADSIGEQRDADGPASWSAIGGTAGGAPSLDALLAAHDRYSPVFDFNSRTPRAQQVSVADSIQRYFPGHPAGWAFYEKYGMRSGILDLFRYFQTAERKYASLDAKLWPATGLDAERLHDMAVLARRIDEPAETRKWVERLVREHPEDPRALSDLAESLHDIELKPVPQLADSMRRWIPVLDTLWQRHPARQPPMRAVYLVRAYGDSATQARWPEHAGMPLGFIYRAASGRALDTSATSVSTARGIASGSCERPAGKIALELPMSIWRYVCSMRKSTTWAYLSMVALAQSRPADALAFADSGLQFRGSICNANAATRARAHALLASGDTAAATREFAVVFGQLARPAESPDSLLNVLGRHLQRASFDSIASATNRSVLACEQARIAANLARQRRERQR